MEEDAHSRSSLKDVCLGEERPEARYAQGITSTAIDSRRWRKQAQVTIPPKSRKTLTISESATSSPIS